MKKPMLYSVAALFLMFSFSFSAFAGEIEPNFAAYLQTLSDNDFASAIVYLQDRPDVKALDQVLHSAAKMLYMSGGQFNIPMVFRGPTGAALQLGAQHSQAAETWYLHAPGIKVVTPATPADAKGLMKAAIRDDDPVAVMEGELLYNLRGEVP